MTNGSVTRKTSIQVGDLTAVEYSAWCHDNATTDIDIPNWVRVIKIKPDRRDAFYIPFYMDQASTTKVRVYLNSRQYMSLTAQDGHYGDFTEDKSRSPHAKANGARNDNDNITIYWSREINKVPSTQWRGKRGYSGATKSHPSAPDGWDF